MESFVKSSAFMTLWSLSWNDVPWITTCRFLAKILVAEGAKDVPVGQPIAITIGDLNEIQNLPNSVLGGSDVKETKSTQTDVKTEDSTQESSSDESNETVVSFEKLLTVCQSVGLQVDEIGACLYPPQEVSAIRTASEKSVRDGSRIFLALLYK
ncbi:dihydrolipoamide acetyltransferase, long form protein [Artemisia annua]|uniref:Dihydrolipoamide acetyltransferase, long form protein n=1 Tax=Artemisia annua TaxID=35608 RepID=A0A2U1MKG4_ARTAN|nr:dihydrolipoamide acetyltransferase, long form protein [Artemisia annua]